MWMRFLPHMCSIREIVAAGKIGEVCSLISDHTQKRTEDAKHRLNDLALGGGALLDLGIYPISFAWDILGKPATIKASATFKATGADAQVATIFHYASGAIATTLSSSDSAGANRASIAGIKGRIEIDHAWYTPTTFRVYDNSNVIIETFDGAVEGRGMQFQADEAERLIASGVTAGEILPPAQSVEIMQALDEIRAQNGLKYPGEWMHKSDRDRPHFFGTKLLTGWAMPDAPCVASPYDVPGHGGRKRYRPPEAENAT